MMDKKALNITFINAMSNNAIVGPAFIYFCQEDAKECIKKSKFHHKELYIEAI
jgi:hypothetical protein